MNKGDIVRIIKLGNGQCHHSPGDGETYLLGRLAEVVEVLNERVFVTPLDYDYTIWFSKNDLQHIPKQK